MGPSIGMGLEASAISARAMLVSLSISQWSARTLDRKVTEEVAKQHGADSSVGRYTKTLLQSEALEKAGKVADAARKEVYALSLPWTDAGYRILPSAAYFDLSAKVAEYEAKWRAHVDAFLGEYDTERERARVRLNGLFRESDYPSRRELERKFCWSVRVMPMPEASDFRVQLGDSERDRIRRQIADSVHAAVAEGMSDVWRRLYDAVSHMAERLQAYSVDPNTGKTTGAFRDSLVENLRELVEVLPKLNLTGDSSLEDLTRQVRDRLTGHTVRSACAITTGCAKTLRPRLPTSRLRWPATWEVWSHERTRLEESARATRRKRAQPALVDGGRTRRGMGCRAAY
jgi:hypothetical protein